MKRCDKIICAIAVAIGWAWFAAAQIAYDVGSPYANLALMLGMLAVWYVPPATMYLVNPSRAKVPVRRSSRESLPCWSSGR